MKQYVILIFLLGFCMYSSGQQPLQLKKGRINTINGELIKFNNLREGENEFIFNKASVTGDFTIKTDDVLKIDKKVGDHALQFGLIMGASGLLGGIIGYKISESSLPPGYVIDRQASTRNIIILSGISALAGVIWGANVPKYETAYENSKYSSIFSPNLKLTFSLGDIQQVGLVYRF